MVVIVHAFNTDCVGSKPLPGDGDVVNQPIALAPVSATSVGRVCLYIFVYARKCSVEAQSIQPYTEPFVGIESAPGFHDAQQGWVQLRFFPFGNLTR